MIQAGSEIWRSQVQDPLRPLTEFVPCNPWFNFSVAFVKRQLLCLQPVGILKKVVFVVLFHRFVNCVSLTPKSTYKEQLIKYLLYSIVFKPFFTHSVNIVLH